MITRAFCSAACYLLIFICSPREVRVLSSFIGLTILVLSFSAYEAYERYRAFRERCRAFNEAYANEHVYGVSAHEAAHVVAALWSKSPRISFRHARIVRADADAWSHERQGSPLGKVGIAILGDTDLNAYEEWEMCVIQLIGIAAETQFTNPAIPVPFRLLSSSRCDDVLTATKGAERIVENGWSEDYPWPNTDDAKSAAALLGDVVASPPVRLVLGRCYARALRILCANSTLVARIAAALREHGTLTREDLEKLFESSAPS